MRVFLIYFFLRFLERNPSRPNGSVSFNPIQWKRGCLHSSRITFGEMKGDRFQSYQLRYTPDLVGFVMHHLCRLYTADIEKSRCVAFSKTELCSVIQSRRRFEIIFQLHSEIVRKLYTTMVSTLGAILLRYNRFDDCVFCDRRLLGMFCSKIKYV